MQVAIPHAPRAVKLSQVPGALGRLGLFAALSLLIIGALAFGALLLTRSLSEEAATLARAQKVEGQFVEAKLPPKDKREDAFGTMSVLYTFEGKRYSASGVPVRADVAEGYGPGAQVQLYVDPRSPDHPHEAEVLERRVERGSLLPYGIGFGVLLGAALFAWELMRVLSRELEPLRKGLIVWLTPNEPLPDTKSEIRFGGHYFRQDVRHEVKARVRPGRAPVRNGEKVLAAVSPRFPGWARVVDEDLARALGWIRG